MVEHIGSNFIVLLQAMHGSHSDNKMELQSLKAPEHKIVDDSAIQREVLKNKKKLSGFAANLFSRHVRPT